MFNRVTGPFSRLYFIDKIREYLLRAGISTRGYSGHSLRKGAAVTAAAKGISRDEIKILGRWKSDAVDLYINEVSQSSLTSNLLSLNSKFLNCTPHSSSLGPSRMMLAPIPTTPPRRLARRDLQRSPRGSAAAR